MKNKEKKKENIENQNIEEKENKKKKIGITHYLKKHRLGIFLYILVYLIAGTSSILSTLAFAEMVVNVSNGIYLKAVYILCFILGLALVRRISWYLSGLIYQKVSNAIMSELNYDLSRQAFTLNSKTFTDHNTGTFVQRLVHDPERVVGNLADLVDILTDILTTAIILIYITTLNIYIGLIVVAVLIVGIILERYRIKYRVKNRRNTRRKGDKVNSLSTEIVKSEKDIKSLGLEEKLSEVAKENYVAYKRSNYKTEMTDMNFYSLRNLLIEVVSIGILILGIKMLDRGLITLATFMIIYSYDNELYRFVWSVGHVLRIYGDVKVCTERMFALFDENEFITEKFGNVHLENVKGLIEFKHVDYSYIEYENSEDKPEDEEKKKLSRKERKTFKNKPKERVIKSTNHIFEDLSFKIEPNTTVAFVGKSGSGKSTILNLMSKMYEVDNGEVLIDKININDLDKDTLRKTISLVNQFPYIFDMTIRENLLLAKRDASEEELKSAIKSASLSEFIDTLHDGLDTKVGESGIKLSGGQKQRLAIARALLRNSSIIIFDESTSSLDNFAQEEIKHSIDALKGKSTIVIVAHRLSTIRNVDKIFFLDEGKIEDIGTFEYLFENNVKFKNMFYAENLN